MNKSKFQFSASRYITMYTFYYQLFNTCYYYINIIKEYLRILSNRTKCFKNLLYHNVTNKKVLFTDNKDDIN